MTESDIAIWYLAGSYVAVALILASQGLVEKKHWLIRDAGEAAFAWAISPLSLLLFIACVIMAAVAFAVGFLWDLVILAFEAMGYARPKEKG